MDRFDCLSLAREAVTTRADTHGAPESNFERIAALWTIVLAGRLKDGATIAPTDVALCLDAVKTARLIQNPRHVDSWVDKAGYAACGMEIASSGPAA